MSNRVPPMGFNDVTTADLSGDLGNVYEAEDGKAYRLVKAGANIASAAKKALVTALSSAAPTWVVDTTTTANDHLAAGLVPSGINTISDTADRLDSGDYFFVQVSGHATAISAAATDEGALVGTSTTAGKVDDASIDGAGAIGVALKDASVADEDLEVLLRGLR